MGIRDLANIDPVLDLFFEKNSFLERSTAFLFRFYVDLIG
jgi:hypothetical protein